MDAVGQLVSQLHVTHPAADPPLQAVHAPSPPAAAAKGDNTKPVSVRDSKKAAAKDATATGKGTKQPAAVYSRQGRQAAAQAGDAARATAGTESGAIDQVTAAQAAAASDEPSPSNSRPLRQRAKAQPYWMSGAAGNSPSARPGPEQQAVPAASDAVLASDTCDSAPAEQSHDDTAKGCKAGGMDQKAGVTKRQARSSPHREQQQPAKKSRAANKQQPEEKPETHSEAEVAAEVEGGAGAGRVAKQGKAKEGHGTRQAGKAGKQQEEDDQATIANDAAVEGPTEAARKDTEVRQAEQPQDV